MTQSNKHYPPVTIAPEDVHATIARYMLADGEHLVVDLKGSHGPYLRDAKSGREYLDFYAYFASQPVAHNHPRICEPEFLERISNVALYKPANSDVYTTYMAEFVETFARVAKPADMPYLFFVDGGSAGGRERAQDGHRLEGAQEPGRGQGRKGHADHPLP